MSLIAGSVPYSDWESMQDLLDRAGVHILRKQELDQWCTRFALDKDSDLAASKTNSVKTDARSLLESVPRSALLGTDNANFLSTLEYWLREFAETHLLLFYVQPQNGLVNALIQGDTLADFGQAWQSGAENVLACYRRNRNNVSLIDVNSALQNPAKFLSLLEQLISIRKRDPAPLQGKTRVVPELYRLIGAQYVGQSWELVALSQELEASSQSLGEGGHSNRIDCKAAYEDYRALQQQADRTRDLDRENELLRFQMRQLQEELEEYYVQVQNLIAERNELIGERNELSAAIELKMGNLDAMERSISWKITAPLRRFVGAVIELQRTVGLRVRSMLNR